MRMATEERRPLWMSWCDERILFGSRTDGLGLEAERGWLLGHTRYARSNPLPDQRRKFVHDCSVQFE
jgi:hypothetical protein